jgi:hypothetical protein
MLYKSYYMTSSLLQNSGRIGVGRVGRQKVVTLEYLAIDTEYLDKAEYSASAVLPNIFLVTKLKIRFW